MRRILPTAVAAVLVSVVLAVFFASARADQTVIVPEAIDLNAEFPKDVEWEMPVDADWSGLAQLRVTLQVPKDVPLGTTVLVYLKDAQWNWYQYQHPVMLKSGRPNVLVIDMTARSSAWKPRGHARSWDGYVTQKVRTFGIKVFNPKPWKGTLRLERVEGTPPPPTGTELCFLDLHADSDRVGRYQRYELSFDLSRTYENPFDPDEIDVLGTFTAPSGKTVTVPAFYYRDFTRRLTGLGVEQLVPLGRSYWKLRFTPTELGSWTVTLLARDKKDKIKTLPLTFRCVESDSPGFVRVDPKDPFYFSFDSGKFFYPVGQMLRSPTDLRVPYPYGFTQKEGEGTFAFDRYFEKLSANGVNFVRTWMGNWWLGIEAPRSYAPGYDGLGKYNMEHAWKLDYVLEQARRRGIYVELTLLNHGLLHRSGDTEWYENPYNALNGGPLNRPPQFFTDAKAKEFFKRRLRYIVARWGCDTHLFSWEMWNEVDLTEGYDSDQVRAWHAEMIDYLNEIDPYHHITTTHFCRQPMDPNVNSLDQIKFTQSDLYTDNIVSGMQSTWISKQTLQKGTIVNEYGIGNDFDQLQANFHGGLWSSAVVPMAGSAMFWWWPWVDNHDLYWHYKAVSAFCSDEDRRGRNLKMSSPEVLEEAGKTHRFLRAVGSQNLESALVWVYDEPIFEFSNGARYHTPPTFTDVSLRIVGLQAGAYVVSCYDTTTGKIVANLDASSDGTALVVKLPTFRADLALKVKRK